MRVAALSDGPMGGPDSRLRWKIRLFSIAAGLGIGGIAMGSDRLVGTAVVVLLAGFLLRWFPR